MAGQLKRENPTIIEDLVLIRALRDSNLPKFLADDAILFKVRYMYLHTQRYKLLIISMKVQFSLPTCIMRNLLVVTAFGL